MTWAALRGSESFAVVRRGAVAIDSRGVTTKEDELAAEATGGNNVDEDIEEAVRGISV